MNLLTTHQYFGAGKALIVRELFKSDQLSQDAHIEDAIVLRTDQLEQIAQRILEQLMADPEEEKPADVNAWSVDE